ncbi:MAG: PIN domain-containing protein [Planctomycetaceae bacterium]|nr:PIN domain-containing protein [Planctomycetaceae bacterium]
MLVLDTDVVTLLQYPESALAQRLTARLVASGRSTAVAITTFEEQARGRLAECARAKTPEVYIRATARLSQLLREYQNRIILPFDDRAAAHFRVLKAAKIRIGTMDLWIASIVLAHDATLITMNLRDYEQVPGLKVEDWTTS